MSEYEPINVITATFAEGEHEVILAEGAWQWDYGRILVVKGIDLPTAFEVHFSNSGATGDAIPKIGTAEGVEIPNELLESGKAIYAWFFLHDTESDGETKYAIWIPVRRRNKRPFVDLTPEQGDVINQAIAALNTAVTETSENSALAVAAQGAAEQAMRDAQSARDDAQTAQGLAEGARDDAQAAMRDAKDAKDLAQAAYGEADNARADVLSALNDTRIARDAAQTANTQAQGAKTDAVKAKNDAITAKGLALASEQNAAQSASQANGYAGAAYQSAGDAADSAHAADVSAGIASDQATLAAGSADNASLSAQSALGSEESARALMLDAEAWATGNKNGSAVSSSAPQHENNAQYYAGLAEYNASQSGYMDFYIDENGHLIYRHTRNMDNLDFELVDGRLIAVWP